MGDDPCKNRFVDEGSGMKSVRRMLLAALAFLLVGCEKGSTGNGGAQLGPASAHKDPTAINVGQPDPDGATLRSVSLNRLRAAGFRVADSLPTAGHRRGVAGEVRSAEQIVRRLMALQAVFTWVSAPEGAVPSSAIQQMVSRNQLDQWLTPDERQMLKLSRTQAQQRYANTVGWKLENMWALAWVLGFNTEPDPTSGQLSGEVIDLLFDDFLLVETGTVKEMLNRCQLRTAAQIQQLEDTFYCAHNAVRSAQTGATESVPEGFHPVADGGAIHERRHALSWVLSPDIEWQETDLST